MVRSEPVWISRRRLGVKRAASCCQLKISELRARAERELGPKFDVRDFHAQVLMSGALPLAVLEAKIDRWIAQRKAA